MKYLLRALRYFMSICLLLVVILAVLAATKVISSDVNVMFRNGWTSVGEIALIFFVFSLVYPKLSFGTRVANATGDPADNKAGVISFMEERGYKLVKEEDEGILHFIHSNFFSRLTRSFSDEITISPTLEGYNVEGHNKDVVRLIYGLESKFSAAADKAE